MNLRAPSLTTARGTVRFIYLVAYITLTTLQALIPEPDLTRALDDDADGQVDAFEAVQAAADKAVDALLSGRFAVPFTGDVPPIVTNAAAIFAAELCYKRRGVSDEANPWREAASAMRKSLIAIANGESPLAPAVQRAMPSGSIIKETAPTFSTTGGRMT